ncbi:putative hypoxanthine oxidase XdhD [Piscinibacter sakaiensis]|uniref:Putative hypoxanthine oxidase XdhD n=1 Tax=Piscinibacter sakaiensis TaxID=1547922 RepID=A0A0K8P1A6_PISS1|nr:putative hypoxanthine oxidase XdhD [Piscinibacter sakaiensis]
MIAPDTAGAAARFGAGQAVRRIEDPALVTGRGRYTDDVVVPGELTLMFLRSPHAHARVLSIDPSSALALPGVVAVMTGADLVAAGVKPLPARLPFKRSDGSPAAAPARLALAHEVVRFAGEAVALVVADDPAAALAALDAIQVDYDPLPAVTDPRAAMAAGAPRLGPAPDNVVATARHGDAAATAAAFARATHTVVLDLVNQRLAPSPIEPRACAAHVDPDSGRLVIRCASQMPTAMRDLVAVSIPGLDPARVRVTVGDVGGGFGMKGTPHPEDLAVAYAAWTLKRPVKWSAQRLEDFCSAVHGRDVTTRAELALDAEGRVLALRLDSLANVGGYAAGPGAIIQLLIGAWVSTSVYDVPAIDLSLSAVLTTTPPVGAYRGAGRPEFIYLIERLMGAAARRLGLAPDELRRRNLVRPEQMPYRNAMDQVYDVGEFARMLEQVRTLSDWDGYAARAAASAARGRLRGRGVVCFLEWTGGNVFDEAVTVTVMPDGIIELVSATQAMGQGIATSYAQLAVDVFDVPIERIRIVQGDTDRANGFGSAGSRSLFTGGAAVQAASQRTVETGKQLAGEALEVATEDLAYRAGRYQVVGTDLGIGLAELAARQPGARLVVEGGARASAPSWPNAAHVCEVEIDPETGEVEVVGYDSVNDIGRVVSPAIVRGQIEGGVLQGLGQALCEEVRFDPDSGQLLSASFMDYALPHADAFRGHRTVFDTSVPCTTNALGVKGVGELGTIGATPAAVLAVIDAFDRIGLGDAAERLQMPLTAPKLWGLLQQRAGA